MSPLLLDNKPYVSEEFYDSSPNFDYSQEYEAALKTPLPEFGRRRRIRRIPGNQFGYFNFGLLRNLKFGKSKRVYSYKPKKIPGLKSVKVNKSKKNKDYSQEYEEAMRVPLPEFEKEEKISYAFNLVFQSVDKTLTDTEINEIMEKITSKLNSQNGWQVR